MDLWHSCCRNLGKYVKPRSHTTLIAVHDRGGRSGAQMAGGSRVGGHEIVN